MAFKVNSVQCRTCIFGANSPVAQVRFEQLRAEWQAENVVQECHDATQKHLHIGCRGHYEAARRGEIPHPIESIAINMGLAGVSMDNLMQMYERMGLIIFVDIPSEVQENA